MQVFYLEKVLNSLERYAHSTARDVCYILLLWMIILCKNPFDLSRFDVTAKGNRNTIHRIIDVATPYLYQNINKCQVPIFIKIFRSFINIFINIIY